MVGYKWYAQAQLEKVRQEHSADHLDGYHLNDHSFDDPAAGFETLPDDFDASADPADE